MAPSSSQQPRRRNGINDKSNFPLNRRNRKKNIPSALFPRLMLGCVTTIVLVLVVAIGIGFATYNSLTAELIPRLESIKGRTTFETSRLYDRNGKILYEFFGTGRRTKVSLTSISKQLIGGTVSIEDKTFFTNPGVDWVGILRAALRSATAGEVVGGGSTISQQVIKQVVLTEQERATDMQSKLRRKVLELVMAQELSRQFSKSEILELYLNEIYYGNLAYGIEAASNTYFKTTADKLTLPQSALLAGMPQLPSVYDPYLYITNNTLPGVALPKGWLNPNFELSADLAPTKWRQISVLRQMVANNYITESDAIDAAQQDLVFAGQEVPIIAPHFVFYVRHQLEELYGPQFATLGYSIYTTIDLELQQTAQKLAAERIDTLKDRNIHNAAVVVLQPNTGQVLAMVGSVDYNRSEMTTTAGFEGNVLDGQVNVTTNLRQPGSALKPFTYISAMEQGMTPASILWDVQTTFPSTGTDRYEPKNYNGKWNGPVRMRQSVANSLNMPAIEALKYAGISNTIDLLHRAGITSLKRGEGFYGLALTLGGGEVTPLDLTTAYNTLASNGHYYPPTSILKVVNATGQTIEQFTPTVLTPVINPELVSIMADMMSDDNARAGIWGLNSKLKLTRPAAVKTGTSNDWRDAWAIGFTPYVTIGVWTGNNNNEPTGHVESLTGGGMIWRNLMEYIFTNERLNTLLAEPFAGKLPTNFTRAQGLQELPICHLPGPFNNRDTELFTRTMLPMPVPPPSGATNPSDPTILPASDPLIDPCSGLLLPVSVVAITDTIPLSGVITDTAILIKTVCMPTPELLAPPERKMDGVAWVLPLAEPGINSLFQWELFSNAVDRQPRILPIDSATIPQCTTEILGAFGPPVPGAVRMPDLRHLDAQIAQTTMAALGITSVYVDLQSRDRIPSEFDSYQPNEVISTLPAQGGWILPGTTVVIGARAP